MTENVKIVWLGDLHGGAIPTHILKEEIDENFIKIISELEFDILIQGGDWFDKKLSLESNDSKYLISLVHQLIKICEDKNAQFRMICGTRSHDGLQHQNYKPLELSHPNFKIINRLQNEWMTIGNENYNILYLPEEYPGSISAYEEYYYPFLYTFDETTDEYFPIKYDMIFGHGDIEGAMTYGVEMTSERPHSGYIPHSMDALKECTKSICWFGHVHKKYMIEKTNEEGEKVLFGSSGSFTTWSHGEEDEDKGFNIITLNREENNDHFTFDIDFVENEGSRPYHTIDMSDYDEMSFSDIIADLAEKSGEYLDYNGRIRLDLTKSIHAENIEWIAILREFTSKYRNVDLKYPKRKVMTKISIDGGNNVDASDVDDSISDDIKSKMDMLRDESISIQERLLNYILHHNPEWDGYLKLDDIHEITSPSR